VEVTVAFVHFAVGPVGHLVVGQVGHVGITVTVFFPFVVVTVVVDGVQGSAKLLLGTAYIAGGFAAPSAAVLKARTARIVCLVSEYMIVLDREQSLPCTAS
jgi:uncharacterized membrane protein